MLENTLSQMFLAFFFENVRESLSASRSLDEPQERREEFFVCHVLYQTTKPGPALRLWRRATIDLFMAGAQGRQSHWR